MSVRAVGWLQSKLGLDIGGRGSGDGDSGTLGGGELAGFSTTENRSYSTDPIAAVAGDSDPSLGGGGQGGGGAGTFSGLASGLESKLGQVWKQASDKATHYWNTSMRGRTNNDPFGFGPAGSQGGMKGNAMTDDRPELDENGLPVTRNWYYYDTQLGRWTVSRDAPESVQREYYEKLEEANRERMGEKKAGPPPPAAATRGPPPLLGAPGRGHGGGGPQYAVPDYFGTVNATPAAPRQEAQAYGVYGDVAPQYTPSAAPVGLPPPTTMSTHPGASYLSNQPTSGATASATMPATLPGHSLLAHAQATSTLPPPAQAYLPAVPATSAPAFPNGGSAYAAASAPHTGNLHAPSFSPPSHMAALEPTQIAKTGSPPPPPIRALPALSNPPSKPHLCALPAHNDMLASPPARVSPQQYVPPPRASQAPSQYPSISGNNGVDVPSSSSAHASAPAAASYPTAAPDTYLCGRGSASDTASVHDSTAAAASARAPAAAQASFGVNTAAQWQQPQAPSSNPYAFPAPVTATAQPFAAAPVAPVQPSPPKAEATGYGAYPSAAAPETFSATGTAATRPSAAGLPPPPSFKRFAPS
ncbi:hypothetical protein LSCM1_03463 [Leishmania martiniquensis]|uniref:Uncharacterized protein n=1 Tax=Leishmania martiniquensis TaxID=1580590 RepID=A0A836H0K3_9TRYP|nr:hypothetical protein LSCM1_03463 [Leishmania martiniquensis]